ncbi:O-antigen ligase family protein [Oceanobacillus caeni]|uniref:O-antigen ligase-related domain-containing protein n=1 Tax=Oceanobacillus caeni TaxID=405946 RepID=A0ABR5MJU7_9BACI|nr:O-antigen ligase family protein [Oceanobacillus caeni]KPH75940.1 hypothetical protein AFL42_07850 [Oceanobacillus caeni]
MAITKGYIKNSRISLSNIELFLVVFLSGTLNATSLFEFMGLGNLSTLIKIAFYTILFLSFFLLVLKKLLIRNLSFNYKYWIILFLGVALKIFILFIQNPSNVLPGGKFFSLVITFGMDFILMVYLSNVIKTIRDVKISVYGLGLGLSLTAMIPILLFPELIGYRVSVVQGFTFIGGFWNASVISFISVGWLLIAVGIFEKNKSGKTLLYSIFCLIIFGGVAGLSRAILLSTLISLIVYLFFSKKISKYIKTIILGIIIFTIIIYFFPTVYSNFSERLDDGLNVEEEPRVEIWKDYLESIKDYVFFGEIEGNFTIYSSTAQGPHSVLFNWIVHFGLLGLIGFIYLIKGLLSSIKAIKSKFPIETSAAIYAWVAAYLAVALINQTGFEQLTVFAGFGIILGWGNINSSSKLE